MAFPTGKSVENPITEMQMETNHSEKKAWVIYMTNIYRILTICQQPYTWVIAYGVLINIFCDFCNRFIHKGFVINWFDNSQCVVFNQNGLVDFKNKSGFKTNDHFA